MNHAIELPHARLDAGGGQARAVVLRLAAQRIEFRRQDGGLGSLQPRRAAATRSGLAVARVGEIHREAVPHQFARQVVAPPKRW